MKARYKYTPLYCTGVNCTVQVRVVWPFGGALCILQVIVEPCMLMTTAALRAQVAEPFTRPKESVKRLLGKQML